MTAGADRSPRKTFVVTETIERVWYVTVTADWMAQAGKLCGALGYNSPADFAADEIDAPSHHTVVRLVATEARVSSIPDDRLTPEDIAP